MYAKRIKLKKNLPRIKLYHNLHNRLMVTGSLAQLVESRSANLGLNFNPGFFFFLTKAFSWIIFSILFRVSNHKIVQKLRIKLNLLFKLSPRFEHYLALIIIIIIIS